MARTTRKITDNPVVCRIVDLIRKQGKKEKDLTDYIGIAPGAMSKWKYDGSYVYIKYIYEICEFLGTTPNYLFFGPEDGDERLSLKEKELIRKYRGLDAGRKKCIEETLNYFAKKSNKNERKHVVEDDNIENLL